MVNIIKGGTNISPLLSAIVLSVLRLTAQKKILIKDTSYNTIVKLPKNVIKSIKPFNSTPTKAKPAKPTNAKPLKRKFKGGGAAEFFE